jgi:hypothetical protein
MPPLIVRYDGWLGKRYGGDQDAAAIKLRFERAHLTEVSLAGQSSEMAEKNEEQIFWNMLC